MASENLTARPGHAGRDHLLRNWLVALSSEPLQDADLNEDSNTDEEDTDEEEEKPTPAPKKRKVEKRQKKA